MFLSIFLVDNHCLVNNNTEFSFTEFATAFIYGVASIEFFKKNKFVSLIFLFLCLEEINYGTIFTQTSLLDLYQFSIHTQIFNHMELNVFDHIFIFILHTSILRLILKVSYKRLGVYLFYFVLFYNFAEYCLIKGEEYLEVYLATIIMIETWNKKYLGIVLFLSLLFQKNNITELDSIDFKYLNGEMIFTEFHSYQKYKCKLNLENGDYKLKFAIRSKTLLINNFSYISDINKIKVLKENKDINCRNIKGYLYKYALFKKEDISNLNIKEIKYFFEDI